MLNSDGYIVDDDSEPDETVQTQSAKIYGNDLVDQSFYLTENSTSSANQGANAVQMSLDEQTSFTEYFPKSYGSTELDDIEETISKTSSQSGKFSNYTVTSKIILIYNF